MGFNEALRSESRPGGSALGGGGPAKRFIPPALWPKNPEIRTEALRLEAARGLILSRLCKRKRFPRETLLIPLEAEAEALPSLATLTGPGLF